MSTESPTTLPAWAIEAARRIRIEVDGLSADELIGFDSELQTIAYIIERERIRTASVGADAAQMKSDIDKFWFAVHNSWDIEPREYFEAEARKNGFDSPLAMAVHYMWKRKTKAAASPSPAAEIVAEMAREKDSEASQWPEEVAVRLHAEADALREAERRIRAVRPSQPLAKGERKL